MTTPNDVSAVADETEPARLSALSFGLALAVTLAIFFFLNPFWEELDVVEVDQNIWWSYAPIPLLVLVLLAVEKKLARSAWFLETLKLVLVKFAITYLVGNIWWTLVDAPEARLEREPVATVAAPKASFSPHAAPPPTSLAGVARTTLEGVLRDAAGAPVADAFVFVAAGLEDIEFAPPASAALLAHESEGYAPVRSICQVHQSLRLRSAPDLLHTAELRDARGKALMNVPAVAGAERELMFARERGILSVQCRVHGHDERPAQLAVFAHPFATLTDAEGRFRLADVPDSASALGAWADETRRVELALGPREALPTSLELRLP